MNKWISRFNHANIWRKPVKAAGHLVQVPTFDRWLYVNLHVMGLMGNEDYRILREHVRPGMRVVDVGANIGLYSLLLADLVGEKGNVFAFEPDPVLFKAALTNCRQNGKSGIIQLQNVALGSREQSATLYRGIHNSGDNRLSPTHEMRTGVSVLLKRLDDMLPTAEIDFIKMDVQGWEAEVMRGMEGILSRNRNLTIYFEYWPYGLRAACESPSAPLELLQQFGFAVFRPNSAAPMSMQQLQELATKQLRRRWTNLIARRPDAVPAL